jgi:hypothetical protein
LWFSYFSFPYSDLNKSNIRLTFKSVPAGLGVVLALSSRKNHAKGFVRLKRLLGASFNLLGN